MYCVLTVRFYRKGGTSMPVLNRVAQAAEIQAAKHNWELIPMCPVSYTHLQQLVNMGKGPPFFSRSRNSADSSSTVRSAPKLVSYTSSAPDVYKRQT